jgi:putative glycosyltransferase (TIGR04372 family)
VATLYGMPMLLTNCGLFYLSGMLKNHLVSYKKLKDKNARVLSARETFSFPIVGYSEEHEFRRAGLTPLDHTRDELALLIDEALARLVFHTWETPPDQEALERKFRSLVPPNSWAAVSPASPAYHYLRSLRWE